MADDPSALAYIDSLSGERRELFDRVRSLISSAFPEVELAWTYKMPTFVVRQKRLYVAAWAHGVSLYGWSAERDGGFGARHPTLVSGRGTIRLRPSEAADIGDDELLGLIRGTLGG